MVVDFRPYVREVVRFGLSFALCVWLLGSVCVFAQAQTAAPMSNQLTEALERLVDPALTTKPNPTYVSGELTKDRLDELKRKLTAEIESRVHLTSVSEDQLVRKLDEALRSTDFGSLRDKYVVYAELFRRDPARAAEILQNLNSELPQVMPDTELLPFVRIDSIINGYVAVSLARATFDDLRWSQSIAEVLGFLDSLRKLFVGQWNYPESYEIVFSQLQMTWNSEALDTLRRYESVPGLYFNARVSRLRLQIDQGDLTSRLRQIIDSAYQASMTERANLAPEYYLLDSVPLVHREFLKTRNANGPPSKDFADFLDFHARKASSGWYTVERNIEEWGKLARNPATEDHVPDFFAIAADETAPVPVRQYALELYLVREAALTSETIDMQVIGLINHFDAGLEFLANCCPDIRSEEFTEGVKRAALYYLAYEKPSVLAEVVPRLPELDPKLEHLVRDVQLELYFKLGNPEVRSGSSN